MLLDSKCVDRKSIQWKPVLWGIGLTHHCDCRLASQCSEPFFSDKSICFASVVLSEEAVTCVRFHGAKEVTKPNAVAIIWSRVRWWGKNAAMKNIALDCHANDYLFLH